MFSSSVVPPPPPPDTSLVASSENRFSLIELRRIYSQLVENKSVNDENKNLVVEILRIIAEMVVYGDNKSELLFDFFCEKNMLSLFLEIMWTEGGCPAIVHIQILQTLSILINCVRNDTSLYYLLSNNYINEIIIYPFAFGSDENLCDQFASFMKSLSLKLNIQTVQFFFIEDTGAFPILTRAIGLLDLAAEPMVRISSQSTILNVYKVDDCRSREYALQEEVMHSLFVNIVKLMENQHSTISTICSAYFTECSGANDESKLTRLENQLEDILASTEDWFYYLQDIMDLKILVLRQALIHHLLNEFVYPALLEPIIQYRACSRASVSVDEAKVGDAPNGLASPKKASSKSLVSSQKQQSSSTSSTANQSATMRSLEIEEQTSSSSSASSHSKSLLVNIARNSVAADIEIQSKAVAMNAALVYMLQMLRFITDPLLQRAVLVALYHPLSQSSRKAVIGSTIKVNKSVSRDPMEHHSNVQAKADDVESESTDDANHLTPSDNKDVRGEDPVRSAVLPTEINQYGDTLENIASSGASGGNNQKLVLTSAYLFHLLCVGLIAGNPSRTVDGENYFSADLLNAVQMVRLLQCMDILPSSGVCANLDEDVALSASERAQSLSAEGSRNSTDSSNGHKHRNSRKPMYTNPSLSYEADPDLLSLDTLRAVRKHTAVSGGEGSDHLKDEDNSTNSSSKPMLSVYMNVLRFPGSHSLTTFQVVAHTVYAISNLIHDAFTNSSPTLQNNSGVPLLNWLLNELNTAIKYAALTLLTRTDGPQSEVLLNLVREEMRRYETKKWKTVVFRMYGDILLFLPASTTNMRRLGIDFDIPISQAEAIRKDIQCFLILRALYKHITTLCKFDKNTNTTVDLCSGIKGSDFLCLEEVNMMPVHIADGLSYDMKGKRFLDAVLVHSGATQQQGDKRSSSPAGGTSGSLWSTSASILTMGYLGNKKQSSSAMTSSGSSVGGTTNGSSSGTSTPPKSIARRSQPGSDSKNGVVVVAGAQQNILFIQEPAILLLISQDRTYTKIGFKVFAAIPLLYTDAKIDPEDRKRFKVLVRSWKPLPQMCRVEPEGVTNCDDIEAAAIAAGQQQPQHRTRRGWQTESYRKASERSTFWSLTLAMETEQACMLAVQHIEMKRQEQFAQKMTKLKSLLRSWASETPCDSTATQTI